MFLIINRTIRQSLINFWRNGWLSVAAVSVLVLSLYIVGVLFVILLVTGNILNGIENKINISVYFKSDVSEEKIMEIKKELTNYKEIKSIDYVSREQALNDFKNNNADEPVIIQSLEEIGENPLLASLIVRANDKNQYQIVSDYIASAPFKDDISRINYGRNKEIITKINNLVSQIEKIGLTLAAIFSAVSILIIFNTIRIAIYTHKQEIEVMRLVGASNAFIRLPFLFEGMLYGLIAMLFSSGLIFLTVKLSAHYFSSTASSLNVLGLFYGNFIYLIGVEIIIGAGLGIVSSWIATKKYLKI
jgi:cell division transport system permease protein